MGDVSAQSPLSYSPVRPLHDAYQSRLMSPVRRKSKSSTGGRIIGSPIQRLRQEHPSSCRPSLSLAATPPRNVRHNQNHNYSKHNAGSGIASRSIASAENIHSDSGLCRRERENKAEFVPISSVPASPSSCSSPTSASNGLSPTVYRTPPSSRSRRRLHEVYSDRFIPSRSASRFDIGFSLIDEGKDSSPSSPTTIDGTNGQNRVGAETPGRENSAALSMLLKSELLGVESTPLSPAERPIQSGSPFGGRENVARNLFKFKAPRQSAADDVKQSLYASASLAGSPRLLGGSPLRSKRKISRVPFKVLDAPSLQDDFYLNLVDWSSSNTLAVGLGSCVYLWSACTSKVTKLCDLGAEDSVTSVSWAQRGTHLSVGTNTGEVQIWDAARCKKTRSMGGHSARVGALAWGAGVLASGSRDRTICLRDARSAQDCVGRLTGHKQEVCGLRWSFDDQQLASGGNDNKLFVWDGKSSAPVGRFHDHCAAVKAIAWSPHQHGLLASGGGTADRCIRFWNTLTQTAVKCVDTGSQVCNLMWSRNVDEVVSTHGYSLNQIIVWKYPSMQKVATLTGHTYRVLYLAMSPDGQTIVTGAGDETLRFWNVFPGAKNRDGSRLGTSLLFPQGAEIR